MSGVLHPTRRQISSAVLGVLVVCVVALVSGLPRVAEVIGGAMLVWVAVVLGSSLTRRVVAERDPSRELLWDLLLVVVVVLGLVGIGVMALAIH